MNERDLPCRVMSDLAAHERQQREDALNAVQFDEYQDDHVIAVIGNKRLAKPIQALLTTLHQIEQTQRSFGVDHAKAFDALLPCLKELRDSCRDEWRDL